MTDHEIDRFELLSYLAGDCDEETRKRVADHLHSCLVCNRKLEEAKREREAFLEAHPFESLTQRAQTRRRSSALPFGPVYALAATLVLLVGAGLVVRLRERPSRFRIKGAADIAMFVKVGEQTIEKRLNHVYHPGEYVQITYSCAEADRLALLSIDEQGKVSIYYPSDGDSSVALQKGSNVPLPNSILLDDYIGKELFVAVFSKRPLYVPDVVERVRSRFRNRPDLEKLSIAAPEDGEVSTILIVKARRAL
jgi:hypothetical protein